MHNLNSIRSKYKNKILDIANRLGINSIKVFGSVVRGEQGPNSDIDFLVDVKPGTTFLTLSRFQRELEELMGCRVDVVTETGLSKHLRPMLDLEAVVL